MTKSRAYQELIRRYANNVPENPQEMVQAHAGFASELRNRKWLAVARFNKLKGVHNTIFVTPARLSPCPLRVIDEREHTTGNSKSDFLHEESIATSPLDRCRQCNHRRGWWYAVSGEIVPRGDRNCRGNLLEEFWRVVEGNAAIAQRVLIIALERIARVAQQQRAGCQYCRPVS